MGPQGKRPGSVNVMAGKRQMTAQSNCNGRDPDCLHVPHTIWKQMQSESLHHKTLCERLSLIPLALGHDLRRLHRLQASLCLASNTRRTGDSKRFESDHELISRLAKKCEQVAALSAVTATGATNVPNNLVAIRPILMDAYANWCGEATKKGLSFRAVSPDVMVSTNAFWIGVIASNLIGNAIQNTDTGGVSVDLSRRDGRWVLTVQDIGPGFTPDSITETQPPSPGARGAGLGYGLNLVKQAATLLGHPLTIRSSSLGSIIKLQIS
jgi:signal transduction histidine kinase